MGTIATFFVTAFIGICMGQSAPEATPPQWPDAYYAKGKIILPYVELEEPFVSYVDRKASKSRIDYYGGMDKTFQRADQGLSYKVIPVTTETVTNEIMCFQVPEWEVQPPLPNLDGFELVSKEAIINGKKCEKWRKLRTVYQKVISKTMWLTSRQSTETPGAIIAIPVHYEEKGFDHYYLTYENFSDVTPDREVFELPKNLTCKPFDGSDEDFVYIMNPAKEFVNGHTAHVDSGYQKFTRYHHKVYQDDKSYKFRKEIYRQNMRYIHSTNRRHLSYKLASNHLADLTDSELRMRRGKLQIPTYDTGGLTFNYTQAEINFIPEHLDWRLFGAVSQVKDQAECGSCWAFSVVGMLEGALFLKTGKLTRLSQQALVDCSWGFGNQGCDGGLDSPSYKWIMKHGGIPTEESYGPYLGQEGYCHMNSSRIRIGLRIKDYARVTHGQVDLLKVVMAHHGPFAVSIDASHRSFLFYSHGVYYEPKCKNGIGDLDHGVLAVGYGELNGQRYWLIKNSWSAYWGNNGYILMSQDDNNCGVTTDVTYAIPE